MWRQRRPISLAALFFPNVFLSAWNDVWSQLLQFFHGENRPQFHRWLMPGKVRIRFSSSLRGSLLRRPPEVPKRISLTKIWETKILKRPSLPEKKNCRRIIRDGVLLILMLRKTTESLFRWTKGWRTSLLDLCSPPKPEQPVVSLCTTPNRKSISKGLNKAWVRVKGVKV